MALEINLKGKSVLVTGAGRGLGLDITKALYNQDAIVYALGRTASTMQALKEECPNVNILMADLENFEETRRAVEGIGIIHCVVNNAAFLHYCPLLDLDAQNFMKMLNVNVVSVLNICQISAKSMIQNGIAGSIVNVSGLGSKVGFYGMNGYGITKSALDRLSSGLSQELGAHQIRVNSILPSVIETDMTLGVLENNSEIKNSILGRTPIGKFTSKDEVVNTILFLLSDLSPSMTGEHITVDGGYRRN